MKINDSIGLTLIIGTFFSLLLVLGGGVTYLIKHGQEIMPFAMLNKDPIHTEHFWRMAFSFSSLSVIELGLLALIGVQILRVFLLFIYFIYEKDFRFSLISIFILMTLIYSFIWRN